MFLQCGIFVSHFIATLTNPLHLVVTRGLRGRDRMIDL
jgi:hypothetical protein